MSEQSEPAVVIRTDELDAEAERLQAQLADHANQPVPPDYLRVLAYRLAGHVRTLCGALRHADARFRELVEAKAAEAPAAPPAPAAKPAATQQQQPQDAGERPPLPPKLVQPKVGV